jgi:peptide/nickel transport system substrate-binding protein
MEAPMSHRVRRLVLLSAEVTALVVIAVLSLPPAGDAQAPRGRVIRVAEPAELLNLDAQGQMGSARELYAFAQGLTRSTAAGEVVPALAESWKISPDGKEYVFKLRRGVKFHNGDPLTAADVKWSLERMIDPKTKSRRFATSRPWTQSRCATPRRSPSGSRARPPTSWRC